MLVMPPPPEESWPSAALVVHGTVLREGEDHTTPRVVDAAGPWFVAMTFHAMWEYAPELLDAIPGAPEWREQLEAVRPEAERHLAVHEGHVAVLTERDRAGLVAAGTGLLDAGWTGDAASVRARIDEAAASGIPEIAFSPAGPDVAGELEAFMAAAGG
jgi:5,10-methylenetetrahydromethanopterin reductase